MPCAEITTFKNASLWKKVLLYGNSCQLVEVEEFKMKGTTWNRNVCTVTNYGQNERISKFSMVFLSYK